MQRNEAALLVQRVCNWDRVERRAFYTSQFQFGRTNSICGAGYSQDRRYK